VTSAGARTRPRHSRPPPSGASGSSKPSWTQGGGRTHIEEPSAIFSSYCTPGIAHAAAEGINSRIMGAKRRVGGYRARDYFKTAISFCCGGLQLYAQSTRRDSIRAGAKFGNPSMWPPTLK
jgi:hypothetical protein